MGAVKIQSSQLSVERGPAHAERFGGRRDIAIGCAPAPVAALPAPLRRDFRSLCLTYAEQVRCGQRLLQAVPA